MSAPRHHRGNGSDSLTEQARIDIARLYSRGKTSPELAAMKWPTIEGKTRTLTPKAVREICQRMTLRRTESAYMASMLGITDNDE